MSDDTKGPKILGAGEDIAVLTDHFFVVDYGWDMPDEYLIVRREAEHAASVVARFKDFDYAHFCAKRLNEYREKHLRGDN